MKYLIVREEHVGKLAPTARAGTKPLLFTHAIRRIDEARSLVFRTESKWYAEQIFYNLEAS